MRGIFFDLDNTLYGADRDLFNLIDVRINHYMHNMLGIAANQVDELRCNYWRQYGTTLQGLMVDHAADPEDYLDYVHDIDVASRIGTNDRLRTMLHRLPQRKFVFTNGSHDHALRVLSCLGVADCFEDIYDIRVSDYVPKPNRLPYDAVLAATGMAAQDCVMVEDSPPNLHTAAKLGMKTILISDSSVTAADCKVADAVVSCVEKVGLVLDDWMVS